MITYVAFFPCAHRGHMRGVKGVDFLARAVFEVAAGLRGTVGDGDSRPGPPCVRLVLKGLDGLYDSGEWLRMLLVGVTPLSGWDDGPLSKEGELAEQMRTQVARGALQVEYIGDDLPVGELAARMQAADIYAHLYRAEGFALPVLEAAGSGLPLVVTAGGPTDEYVTDLFALRVPAERVAAASSPFGGFLEASRGEFLVPNHSHAVEALKFAVSSAAWREAAGRAAAKWVRARGFTWDEVAREHLRLFEEMASMPPI